MDDRAKALAMYKMGFGDFNVKMGLKEPEPEEPRRRAIWADWKLHRMPRTHRNVRLGLTLTQEQFEELAWGHIPQAMEDHWFMYWDGKCLDFHRSWSGCCIFRMYVERDPENRDGYVVTHAEVNRKPEQYDETNDARDAVLAEILLGEALGLYMGPLWDVWFGMGEASGAED